MVPSQGWWVVGGAAKCNPGGCSVVLIHRCGGWLRRIVRSQWWELEEGLQSHPILSQFPGLSGWLGGSQG